MDPRASAFLSRIESEVFEESKSSRAAGEVFLMDDQDQFQDVDYGMLQSLDMEEEDGEQESQLLDKSASVVASEDYFGVTELNPPPLIRKVSTSQLLDEVYDVRLRELPEELDEALKLAEKAKVEIINDLYADQIVALEMQIAENSHFEEASKVD
jgi:hypothetical protein